MSDAASATPRVELGSRVRTEATATTPVGKTARSVVWIALFAVAYVLTARLGRGFRFQDSQIGVVWPPNALLLAALLLTPRRSWWLVFAASAVAHTMAMGSSVPAWRVAWQIAANAAFTAATAEAVRRFIGLPLRFGKPRDVLMFTTLSFGVSLLFALTASAFVLTFAGVETAFTPTIALMRVMLSNTTALLIVTPAVVLGARLGPDWLSAISARRALETAVIMGTVLGVGLVAFDAGPGLARLPWVLLLTFPPLMWAAVRLGPAGASASLLCIAALSMWGTARQLGPFVVTENADMVLSLQLYWIVIGPPVMLLAAAIRERARAEATLHDQRNQLARVTRIATAGELSGALAHELRQPITSILANAQAALLLLRRGVADVDQLRPILEDIVRQDQQASNVIARLRSLLQGETPHLEPIAVESVVRDALALTRSSAATAGAAVHAQIFGPLPRVQGDQVQLLQVVVNLVVNACEAMIETAPSERVVQLRVEKVAADRVDVAVIDRGIGLPRDDEDRVFEPFFTTKDAGLGLGLAIGRSIATAHGGRLWARNNDGHSGATFHLELPTQPPRAGRVDVPAGR
jgi:signal transduction histidine kinase